MEKFEIKVKQGRQEYEFEVREYLHHQDEKCQFEIFDNDRMVASFNPDPHEHLSVCKNPGNLDKKLLHLIADKLEPYV